MLRGEDQRRRRIGGAPVWSVRGSSGCRGREPAVAQVR
jgi:hypothetical protein